VVYKTLLGMELRKERELNQTTSDAAVVAA